MGQKVRYACGISDGLFICSPIDSGKNIIDVHLTTHIAFNAILRPYIIWSKRCIIY